MAGQNEAETAMPGSGPAADEAQKRERSSIAFPYMPLDEVMEVATAIHDNVGTGTCSSDQLAAWLKQSPASSAFRIRLSAARLFGLVDTERSDAIKLTELGRLAVDPKREREARATAFLNVPLYRALFDKFKGSVLPPTAALEREIASLGVAEKQKERARQVFERSAEQAGFFEHGKNRLVRPGVAGQPDTPLAPTPGGDGGNGGGGPPTHPLIDGLFKSLPPSNKAFPIEDLVDWLQAAAINLKLVYKTKGTIKIEIPNQLKGGDTSGQE